MIQQAHDKKISLVSQMFLGLKQIVQALHRFDLAVSLSMQDLRQSYRRSKIGPFWITIGMGVMVATIGTVFGFIFGTPMKEFLPFLSASLLVWSLISNTINESTTVFTSAEAIIRQLNLPLFVHVLRLVMRNLTTFGHNVIILPLVFLVFLKSPNISLLAVVPGFAILVVNLAWISLLIGMFSARFRDAGPIISNLLQVAFYLTPIMWQPKSLPPDVAHFMLGFNPFYHLVQIVRLPILGQWPTSENWFISLAMIVVGWLASLALFGKYLKRIAYWV